MSICGCIMSNWFTLVLVRTYHGKRAKQMAGLRSKSLTKAAFFTACMFPVACIFSVLEDLRAPAMPSILPRAILWTFTAIALIEYFAAVGSSVKLDCSRNTCARGFLKFPSKNDDWQWDFLVPRVQTIPYTSSKLHQNGLVNRNLAAGLRQNSRSATTLASNASMGRH